MSFEAYWYDVAESYIQANRNDKSKAKKLQKVEKALKKWVGIKKALDKWPERLTGKPLNKKLACYQQYDNFREYRNRLLHGEVSGKLPSGRLAQDLETIADAELALQAVSEMIKVVATHFGFPVPSWV